jgi:hypothetical protein
MLGQIVFEAEAPDDSATMFRLRVDGNVIAKGLTEGQAHLLVAEILERIPRPPAKQRPALAQHASEGAPHRGDGAGRS